MGSTNSTMKVTNNTYAKITKCNAYNYRTFDFAEDEPNIWNNATISAKGGTASRTLAVKNYAHGCPFTILFSYEDGTCDCIRIYFEHVIWQRHEFEQGLENVCEIKIQNHKIKITRNYRTVNVTFSNTETQEAQFKIQDLTRKAEQLSKKKKYDEGIRKLIEAKNLAYGKGLSANAINNQINKFSLEKAKNLFKDALSAENDNLKDRHKEAENKLHKVKIILESSTLQNTAEKQLYLKMVNLKIEGNLKFNSAVELEAKANDLFMKAQKSGKTSDYRSAQQTFKEAHALYEEASTIFKNGEKINKDIFSKSVETTVEQVLELNNILDDLNEFEVKESAKQLTLNEVEIKEDEKTKTKEHQYKFQIN